MVPPLVIRTPYPLVTSPPCILEEIYTVCEPVIIKAAVALADTIPAVALDAVMYIPFVEI